MPELPFLFFRRPAVTGRKVLFGRGRPYQKPTAAQQRVRLQARFDQIVQSFQGLQATIAGADPEQVIVIEAIADTVDDVSKAASKIPGLEWLAERDLDDIPPEFGFTDGRTPERPLSRRLYALMSSQAAMDQLLGLWRTWVNDPAARARQGFGPFKNLFTLLRDIRRWGPEDRIASTGIIERWQEDVEVATTIRFEVEFWFRSDPTLRQRAFEDVDNLVTGLGGQRLDQCTIPEIRYHGSLVELPTPVVQQFLTDIQTQNYPPLLRSQGVMFFRPQAQSIFTSQPPQVVPFDLGQRIQAPLPADGNPVVAILDGCPTVNHDALNARIIVDDPDDHAQAYQPDQQQHGTAIASLVLHGDLNANGPSLARRVYVRPIFLPGPLQNEITPPNRLLVDLIHRAIRRLFEGDGREPAAAPSVRIINLSLGIPEQPFDSEISPLARLLDWLSWKYKVLIVVSIGNRKVPIALEDNWETLSDDELVARVLQAMQRDQFQRRPLSPAEAINCVSVGAVHADDCAAFVAGGRVDLLRNKRLPSPINTVSSGFRRSTKPEILLPGGRLLYRQNPGGNGQPVFAAADSIASPGIMSAAPGLAPMELNRVKHSCGTSNAAALASRCAALAFERISTQDIPADCDPLTDQFYAVLLKALLVHGASWGEAANYILQAFPDSADPWQKLARLRQQFLGYGEVDVTRCLAADAHRATLLGWSSIAEGQGHRFELPLPPSLSARTETRRLTVTLAWFTPVNQQHKDYRRAQLWIDVPEEEVGTNSLGLDTNSARRGTVEHRIFQGAEAVPFLEGDTLSLLVSCKEDAGKLEGSVPYAVAVTLEVGAGVGIDVYQEIRNRIRQPVAVEVRPQ